MEIKVGNRYRFNHSENLVHTVRGLEFIVIQITDVATHVMIFNPDGTVFPFPNDNSNIWPGDPPTNPIWECILDKSIIGASRLEFKFV